MSPYSQTQPRHSGEQQTSPTYIAAKATATNTHVAALSTNSISVWSHASPDQPSIPGLPTSTPSSPDQPATNMVTTKQATPKPAPS
ncbi:hypothetical protein SMACR_03213 [Sordaria macrospora]|uniref:Uncharacterized protein n=1 Tax=Sordaria macrospora TaxID=5147 RepID=A0A8S9A1B8_SORMA|nr:hypothetical protein SMACR_03213 [Sordaria macrospora]